MPWGWECRSKLIKQGSVKPTEKRQLISAEMHIPGPNQYEMPQIFGGKGYCTIKRAPAYTLGQRTPLNLVKPFINPLAPTLDVAGWSKKGKHRVTHGLMLPSIEEPVDRSQKPAPNAYTPRAIHKTAPAYSCRPAARPRDEPTDMWTPSANMYWPPIPGKKTPAYSLGYAVKKNEPARCPGPGDHDPNYDFVRKAKPSFSFGLPFRTLKPLKSPAPNAYCEKKFMVPLRTVPAISFGIRHSKKRGDYEPQLKNSKLDFMIKSVPE